MPELPPRAAADRNLLFGVLALQMDFVSRDRLVAAMHAWGLDKAKPLGQILLEQGALAEADRAALEALVDRHLGRHGGDPHQSLAAVSPLGLTHLDLEQIADPDLHASLARVAAGRPVRADPDATRSFAASQGAQACSGESAEADSEATRLFAAGTPTSVGQRFRVLRPHARGGLGEVFVARDEELHREVALKEIQERYADDPASRARFVLEAEITGALEHPGIVPVYGLGTRADGRPYYAMRLVKGDSLKQAIERFHKADGTGRGAGERGLALRRLLGRFVDVCNAVAYAHSRGVLHRDLKPGNVMLGPYGETLVLDWGLAKAVGRPEGADGAAEGTLRPPSAGDPAPTQAGTALGTPPFMAPEQAAGRLDRLGPASDV
jgi:tRNA A-37 threonylcarbamoyl transferase component Bud32